MTDIFLSYSHEDEERIKPLVAALESQGWSVFWDRHIPAGQTWRTYIGEALENAKCVLVAWSHNSIASKWVTEEADVGQKRGNLIPIFIDAVEIPIGFRSIQAANLSDWKPDQESPNFNALINDIRNVLHSTETAPIAPQEPKPDPIVVDKKPIAVPTKTPRNIASYKWLALVLIVAIGGYLAYQNWFANSADEEPALSGLVFATRIEANGQALDPGTTFSQDITDLYAVFLKDKAPPGMTINADNPVEGTYYSYLNVIDTTDISRIGWRWIKDGKQVNTHERNVEINENYWLQYWDYDGAGIFGGKFSPGTYTIVILLDGNPAMSSKLVIEPLPVTEE